MRVQCSLRFVCSTFKIRAPYYCHRSYYTIFDPRNRSTWVLKSSDLYLKVTFWPWFGSIIWGVLRMMLSRKFLVYTLFDPKEWHSTCKHQEFLFKSHNFQCIFEIMHESCKSSHLYLSVLHTSRENCDRRKNSGVYALSLPKPVLHNIKLTQKKKNPLSVTLLKGHSINSHMH